jgi:hypothetical protein
MINDEHDDEHVMHDMHTNTMHHAWCQRMPQRQHNAQTHKRTKIHKNKRNVTKTRKNMQSMNKQWRSKKPWQHFEANTRDPLNGKGSLKRGTHVTKQDGDQTKRDVHHTIYVMGATPPSPIQPRTPRRSAHPSLLVENPVDNSSNLDHNVTAVMWKTPKPVENPVENFLRLWKTLWKTPQEHDGHHSI